jgi:hypothetical protein
MVLLHGQKGTSGQASGLNISFFADYKKDTHKRCGEA